MKKKALAWIFLILFLTGCNLKILAPAAPVTFSVLYNNREAAPFKSDWQILEEYEKRSEVTLDIRLGDDKAYDNAISSTLNSGNIPDIILKCYPKSIESYAKSGILLPFSDYESMMPNFSAYIKEHNLQSELDRLRMSDGKYYILPGFQREVQVQQWIYRSDIFEENDIKIPNTYDEMFDSLVELKKIYPDSTPITASWGGAHLFAMMGAGYGIPAGWAGVDYYNSTTNQWQYSPATENYKELYRFLHRCYAAGILDSALFTQSDDEFANKLQNGKAFVTVTWITSGFEVWNEKLRENGIPNGKWEALPVLESTIGIKALPAVDPFRKGLVVPASVVGADYFNQLITFLDWAVYSEEGMELTTWGVEGLTYQKTADGNIFLPDIKTPKNPNGTIEIDKQYGFNQIFNLNENPEYEDYKKPADIVEFLARSEQSNETLPLKPVLKLSDDGIEIIRVVNETLQNYVDEASFNFITGALDIDTDWNNYIYKMEGMGYKIIESVWNEAWKKQN